MLKSRLQRLNLLQAERAVVTCLIADVPVALWGPPGVGKSSVIKQIAAKLKYNLFDFRLSDKEPSDLGGVPYPVDGKLEYLVPKGMPFEEAVGADKAILLLDEFDRADIGVQNAALQVLLDREINLHKLGPNVRIVLAGNATTDIGTSPLSKAAANRICHLWCRTDDEGALDSFAAWASGNDVSEALVGFARFKQEVWCGQTKDSPEPEDMAIGTPRSYYYAQKLLSILDNKAKFKTEDIRLALVAGCVGLAGATEYLAYVDNYAKMPKIGEIADSPETTLIPEEPGVLYALTHALIKATESQDYEPFAAYAYRWPREQAAFFFRLLVQKHPQAVTCPAYREWNGG